MKTGRKYPSIMQNETFPACLIFTQPQPYKTSPETHVIVFNWAGRIEGINTCIIEVKYECKMLAPSLQTVKNRSRFLA